MHDRAPEVETMHSRQAEKHGHAMVVPGRTATHAPDARPCVVAQAAVRIGPAVPALCPSRFCDFRLFICFLS